MKLALLALCLAVVFVSMAAPSRAQEELPLPITTVGPVGMPTPAGGPDPGATPLVVQSTIAGNFIDSILGKLFGFFSGMMTVSVEMGHIIFTWLAAISLLLSSIRLVSGSMEDGLTEMFRKFIWMTLLLWLIDNTFTMTGGGPGWFPLLLGVFSDIGSQVGGVAPATLQSMQWSTTISPGGIVDTGLAYAGTILNGATHAVSGWSLAWGLTNGSSGFLLAVLIMAGISALGLTLAMLFIAGRYFVTLVSVYILGSQAFLIGFLGLEATASIGTGMFALAFNKGIELSCILVMIGLMKPILDTFVNQMFQAGMFARFGSMGTVAGAGTAMGSILVLDVVIALWVVLVKSAPEIAKGAVNAVWSLDAGKLHSAVMQHNMVGRVSASVTRAAGGMMAVASPPTIRAGASSGASIGERVQGAAHGAVRGFVVGGPQGAVAGAAAGAMAAQPKRRAPADGAGAEKGPAAPEGSIHGGGAKSGARGGPEGSSKAEGPSGAGAAEADEPAGSSGRGQRGTVVTDAGGAASQTNAWASGATRDVVDEERHRTQRTHAGPQGAEQSVGSHQGGTSYRELIEALRANTAALHAQQGEAASSGGAASGNGGAGGGSGSVAGASTADLLLRRLLYSSGQRRGIGDMTGYDQSGPNVSVAVPRA